MLPPVFKGVKLEKRKKKEHLRDDERQTVLSHRILTSTLMGLVL